MKSAYRNWSVIALSAALTLVVIGCEKKVDPLKPPQPITGQVMPTVEVPRLPDPVVPKGDESASPKPGQANDHSSPAFKDGGASTPK